MTRSARPRTPPPSKLHRLAAAAVVLTAQTAWAQTPADAEQAVELPRVEVLGTAEDAWKQAPGVSTVTRKDLEEQPSNDLADILRKQPGVNLTGNSTSGQRGNNRQIDLRGMGPENTQIMIDGKPVQSRASVRYGWRGERDTHGDLNWLPPEAIDHIEVLRGPAAARYGSGAMGGVVNIVTRGIPDRLSGSATVYGEVPEDSRDGDSRRFTFSLASPVSDVLGFRLSGNIARTGADAWDINRDHASTRTGNFAGTFPAGREGMRNRDFAGRLTLKPNAVHQIDFDAAFSRQGNIYTGDTQNTNNFTVGPSGALAPTSQRVWDALGSETNRVYRSSVSLTHRGKYDFGNSRAYVQYERTRNTRLDEGLAGGTEGLFSSGDFSTSTLGALTAHGEVDWRGRWGKYSHVMTLGAEYVGSRLDDGNSVTQTTDEGGSVPGLSSTGRSSRTSASITSLFVEDNIELSTNTRLTPGLRFDHHSKAGNNWSPSVNLSHYLDNGITLKAGVARAYKAPNLYQLDSNYLLYSRGNGCWGAGGSCYLQGNPDLKAETSINKELGIEYAGDSVLAGLTAFHNAYRNKVDAGLVPVANAAGGAGAYADSDIFQWTNVRRAEVTGLEGTFQLRIHPGLSWSNNLTWMLRSRNRDTGEQLSIIPKYTLNTRLDWRVLPTLDLYAGATVYGRQKPNRLDFQGLLMTGEEAREMKPYAIANLGGRYTLNRHLALNFGVRNVFDKRIYRKGNAVGVNNPRTIYGAGAYTYNEPGRSFYVSLNQQF